MQLLAYILLQSFAYQAIAEKDGIKKADLFKDAIEVNVRKEHRPRLGLIVAAIRYAENGGPGKEYGIIHRRVKPTYRSQAGWCAATVQKNWDRWREEGSKGEFIDYLGAKYAPIGVDNDPNGLNQNWIKNVKFYVNKLTKPKK